MIGLDDLEGLLQWKWFYESIISSQHGESITLAFVVFSVCEHYAHFLKYSRICLFVCFYLWNRSGWFFYFLFSVLHIDFPQTFVDRQRILYWTEQALMQNIESSLTFLRYFSYSKTYLVTRCSDFFLLYTSRDSMEFFLHFGDYDKDCQNKTTQVYLRDLWK